MQRLTVHIEDETKEKIALLAKITNKLESQVVRDALEAGLEIDNPTFNSAKSLLKLAKEAKSIVGSNGEPTDISSDTAKYAFGK